MLKLFAHHINVIQTHAEKDYPEECCGLLLGQLNGKTKLLVDVVPVENCWETLASEQFLTAFGSTHLGHSKCDRFAISPQTMLQVQKQARDRALNVIGIYHSHPDQAAVPSEFDRAIAWERYSYIIVSVKQGICEDLRTWSLDSTQQFQPEEILKIDTTPRTSE